MSAEVSFVTNRKHHGFMYLLSSAACEWLLIILMFVEAAFSYLLPKFAQYCELEAPCPLCSRLDHVFGNKKPGFCWTLVCKNHKEEISSLMSCTIHGNLADIEGMCEECLISTVTPENSNSTAYKLLVGKLSVDVERSALQNLMLNKHIKLGSSGSRTCSCCNKTWRAKPSAERLHELEKAGLWVSKNNLKPPLPRMPGRSRCNRRENLKRLRNRVAGSNAQQATGRNAVDKLSHVGYTKIKFATSGSESDAMFSEDDDDDEDGTVSGGNKFSRSDSEVKIRRRGIPRPPVKNVAARKQARQCLKDKSDVLDSKEMKKVEPVLPEAVNQEMKKVEPVLSDAVNQEMKKVEPVLSDAVNQEMKQVEPVLSDAANQEMKQVEPVLPDAANQEMKNVEPVFLDAINHEMKSVEPVFSDASRSFQKPSPGLTKNPISLDNGSQTPNLGNPGASEEASNLSVPRIAALSTLSELRSLCKFPSSSITLTSSTSINVGGPSEKINTSVSIHVEAPGSSSDGTCASQPNSQNLTESREHAVEPSNASGSKTEDKKKTLSQDSASELGSLFLKDYTSSKTHDKQSESRKDDDSSSATLAQASTSDVGGLSPKETRSTPQPQDKQNESGIQEEIHRKQNESRKGEETHGELNESREGGETSDKQNESEKAEKACSQAQSQISTSEAGDLYSKESGSKPDDENDKSSKVDNSGSQAPSQASTAEECGILPQDTGPRSYEEQKESMANAVGGILPNNTGIRLHGKSNESRKDEDSRYPSVPGSPSAKRNESASEVVSETESESTLGRLRRQDEHDQNAEHDRNVISSLYKELEEERNAAAVAANEAMVMITKLQEEKAALHTEALQYLRMMDEQAEYDMEALQRANDLLAEREKELQDLEDELEFYRNNFDEPGIELKDPLVLENHFANNSENSPDTSDSKLSKTSNLPTNASPLEFENKKVYVKEFLNKLEDDLRHAYCGEKFDSMPNRSKPDEMRNELGSFNDSSLDMETQTHSQTEGSTSTVQKNSPTSKENSAHGTASKDFHGEKSDSTLDAFAKGNALPDDRLDALQTDRDFLRHASELLWSGKDGLQLIQEVAHQLKELRKIEFKKRL